MKVDQSNDSESETGGTQTERRTAQ